MSISYLVNFKRIKVVGNAHMLMSSKYINPTYSNWATLEDQLKKDGKNTWVFFFFFLVQGRVKAHYTGISLVVQPTNIMTQTSSARLEVFLNSQTWARFLPILAKWSASSEWLKKAIFKNLLIQHIAIEKHWKTHLKKKLERTPASSRWLKKAIFRQPRFRTIQHKYGGTKKFTLILINVNEWIWKRP